MLNLSLGSRGHLTISANEYSPSVQCTDSQKPPVADECDSVLLDMPAKKVQRVFGDHGSIGADITVSWAISSRKIYRMGRSFSADAY